MVPSPLLRWESINFEFHLEIKVRESGSEWLEVQREVSAVSDESRRRVTCWCFFIQSKVNAAFWQEISENFTLKSADQLYGNADFPFQQDFPLPTVPKLLLTDLLTMIFLCLIGLPTLTAWTPENTWGIVKRKMRNSRPDNTDALKNAIKATWASITSPRHAVLMQPFILKEAMTKYWGHKRSWTL